MRFNERKCFYSLVIALTAFASNANSSENSCDRILYRNKEYMNLTGSRTDATAHAQAQKALVEYLERYSVDINRIYECAGQCIAAQKTGDRWWMLSVQDVGGFGFEATPFRTRSGDSIYRVRETKWKTGLTGADNVIEESFFDWGSNYETLQYWSKRPNALKRALGARQQPIQTVPCTQQSVSELARVLNN